MTESQLMHLRADCETLIPKFKSLGNLRPEQFFEQIFHPFAKETRITGKKLEFDIKIQNDIPICTDWAILRCALF